MKEDKPDENDIDLQIQDFLKKKKKELKNKRVKQELERKKTEFTALIDPTAAIRKKLESSGGSRSDEALWNMPNNLCHLLFCGFLERDYTEPYHINAPMTFSGGFFVKTPYVNILFEPGDGTITGLKDLGVNIQDIDIIVCSHYHPQARRDLHNILDKLDKIAQTAKKKHKKIYLLSSEAVINGRNEHYSLLVPSNLNVIHPLIALPGNRWVVKRLDNGEITVNECEPGSTDYKNHLSIRTLPAYHNEAALVGQKDTEAQGGEKLSSFFLETRKFGILYSADTQFPGDNWNDLYEELKKKVTVLIANMKTIAHQTLKKRGEKKTAEPDWNQLDLTYNQLGFEGTKQLAMKLRPRTLVLRGLGLECAAEEEKNGTIRYAPHKLEIIHSAMTALLNNSSQKTDVVIPGRHELIIQAVPGEGNEVKVESNVLVPAFPESGLRKYGIASDSHNRHVFFTRDQELSKKIDYYINLMRTDTRPVMVIQGESGGGKTQLARAIGAELIANLTNKKKNIKELIKHKDLATVDRNSKFFLSELFGHTKDAFTGATKDKPGYFSFSGTVLILNQLEKLPFSETQKFLDAIEDWVYMPLGSEDKESQFIKSKIIFTTNQDIDVLNNLAPDMKNRLRDRCLSIPRLYDMSSTERHEVINNFIIEWCDRNNTIFNKEAWDLLLKADLSLGAFRCLNALLHKAALLYKMEYGLFEQIFTHKKEESILYIEKYFVEKAMSENGVAKTNAFGNCAHTGVTPESPAADLVLTVALWISKECDKRNTYRLLKNAGHSGAHMSHGTFNKKLKAFKDYFTTIDSAWDYFDGFGNDAPSINDTNNVFNREWEKEGWLQTIRNLDKNRKNYRVKERFYNSFKKI